MKSSKQRKEKAEQAFIQGSISKSPIGGKKSSKNLGGQHHKKAVEKDVFSKPFEVPPQHDDCNLDKGCNLETVSKMPLDVKPEYGKTLQSSSKIKLQLFPIDERVRVGLEKDGHNPFLELTLSARKKISSVLKHLCNKWGSSSVAVGELVLFPFNIALENLTSSRRWSSSEIGTCAGDVLAALGSPELFRLRYGWVSFQPNTYPSHCTKSVHMESTCCRTMESTVTTKNTDGTSIMLKPCNENELTDLAVEKAVLPEPLYQVAHMNQDEVKGEDCKRSRSSKTENDTAVDENSSAEPMKNEVSRVDAGISMTSLLWSDLSSISIGGLLSEASLQGRFNTEGLRSGGSRLVSQPTVSDSLDAFIEQYKYPQASTTLSSDMPSSILDAESTCHSFAFSKLSSSSKDLPTLGQNAFSVLSDQNGASESFKCPKSEVNLQGSAGAFRSNNIQEPKTDPVPCSLGVYSSESSLGLSSIRWNDSLGPFDLPLTSRQIIKDDSLSIGRFVR